MSCTLEWSSIRWSSHNHLANDAAARTINEPHHPKKRQDSCFNVMLHMMFDNLLDFCCYLKQAARPTTPPQASSFFKKLDNWVQLSHSSLQSTFAIVGAFNLWEWKVKILCFLTYCTPLLPASYTLPTHSLNIHLAFHFTWTFSLLTACDNTEFHCTNRESGKNATRAQPEMKCKLFYWCLL